MLLLLQCSAAPRLRSLCASIPAMNRGLRLPLAARVLTSDPPLLETVSRPGARGEKDAADGGSMSDASITNRAAGVTSPAVGPPAAAGMLAGRVPAAALGSWPPGESCTAAPAVASTHTADAGPRLLGESCTAASAATAAGRMYAVRAAPAGPAGLRASPSMPLLLLLPQPLGVVAGLLRGLGVCR